uniref:Physical impedance induced protein n=1 Tax=Zea mays TaxID=4577 RepID=O24557_MAIZE|nr:physical impedance induced protein [Zea mays]
MQPGDANAEVSPEMLRRIKRAKRVSQISEKVATGILSGVVKVTGYFTSSLANSKAGKKFFQHVAWRGSVLASLDGFGEDLATPVEGGRKERFVHVVNCDDRASISQVRRQSRRRNERRAGRRRARHRDGVGRVQDPAGLEPQERPQTHGAGHVHHQGQRCRASRDARQQQVARACRPRFVNSLLSRSVTTNDALAASSSSVGRWPVNSCG